MIRVLEEHYRRINFLGQLLSRDRNPARVFERAEELKLVGIEDCDAGSSGIDFDHQSRTLRNPGQRWPRRPRRPLERRLSISVRGRKPGPCRRQRAEIFLDESAPRWPLP